MKAEKIKEELINHGWKYSEDYDTCGIVHFFRKDKYGAVYVSDTSYDGCPGLVFSGALCEIDYSTNEAKFSIDDGRLIPIGDIMSFDFSGEGQLGVREYDGTLLKYYFYDESNVYDEMIPHAFPKVEKPIEEYNADDRPHKMIVEVSRVLKTYVAVYAHDKEEAVNLFTGSDSIEEETYEKEIVGNMVDEAFDKYKVVKEYKDRRTEEVCIAEFNVLM